MSTREVNQSQNKTTTPTNTQQNQNQTQANDKSNETPLPSRITNLLSQAGNQNVETILKKIQPAIDFLSNTMATVLPYVHLYGGKAYNFYNSLPLDVLYALLGLFIAFFGGIYCLFLAAAETFYTTGYKEVRKMYLQIKEEMNLIWEANEKDNNLDEDHSGKADILELTLAQLATRKFLLFLKSCRDPNLILGIVPNMITCFVSVIAVLKTQFAKVIFLGNQIGEALEKPACYFIVPTLGSVLPTEYHKWINPAIHFVCKFVAISIAWFIQRIISSVQSAIRGGLMFSRHILKFAKTSGVFTSYNEDDYFDEALGWFVAFCGFYFQIWVRFGVPFPLNLLFLPITLTENYLMWAVSD
jgi:hypothetical protein